AAVKAGGPVDHERQILTAWKDWYVGAIGTMTDIEVGGSSDTTRAAIASAQQSIGAFADKLIGRLPE
ncbi:MAG TPA: hypothetical protein VFT41_06080, partial [Gemmatimonadaceae bacterium]|nr:hypothetical protein [Gemmatimonadaceae bacterium]